MEKTLSFILAVMSFGNIALAADTLGPDKFLLYSAEPNAIEQNSLIHELKPGDVTDDQIILKNLTPSKKKFTLYVTDGVKQENGSYNFKNVAEKRELAEWISLDTNEVTLKSEEEKKINVHIKIPKDAPLKDYFGGIAGVKTEPSTNNPNINIAIRNVLNLQLKITNTPARIPKLSELQANVFQGPTPFFYGTTALFAGCMIYFFAASRKEKKANKDREQETSNHS